MRARAVYVAALVALMVPMLARAETIQPESTVVSGNAFDVFAFEGEPDEVLIAWGDPIKPRYELPFAVYNGSDEPIVNGRVDAVMASEEWGEPLAFEDESMLPLVIEPGEFGFGRLTFDVTSAFVFIPEDAEFEGTVSNGDPFEGYVDLGTDDVDLSQSGQLEGVVVNTAAGPVGKIEVHSICLEESGVITRYDWDILDRRQLDQSQEEDFRLTLSDNWTKCGDYFFVTAIGQLST